MSRRCCRIRSSEGYLKLQVVPGCLILSQRRSRLYVQELSESDDDEVAPNASEDGAEADVEDEQEGGRGGEPIGKSDATCSLQIDGAGAVGRAHEQFTSHTSLDTLPRNLERNVRFYQLAGDETLGPNAEQTTVTAGPSHAEIPARTRARYTIAESLDELEMLLQVSFYLTDRSSGCPGFVMLLTFPL